MFWVKPILLQQGMGSLEASFTCQLTCHYEFIHVLVSSVIKNGTWEISALHGLDMEKASGIFSELMEKNEWLILNSVASSYFWHR